MKPSIAKKFYVYVLLYPVQMGGEIFYIGKGKNARYSRLGNHINEARRGWQSEKCDTIRDILDKGLQPGFQIIREFDEEPDAFAYESMLIKKYAPTISNIVGSHGWKQKENLGPFGHMIIVLCHKLNTNWNEVIARADFHRTTLSKSARTNPSRNIVVKLYEVFISFDAWEHEWEEPFFNTAGYATDEQIAQARKSIQSLENSAFNLTAKNEIPRRRPAVLEDYPIEE